MRNRKLTGFEMWVRDNPWMFLIQLIVAVVILLFLAWASYFIANKGFEMDDQMEMTRMAQFQEDAR